MMLLILCLWPTLSVASSFFSSELGSTSILPVPQLPILPFVPRADWLNVQTMGAKGDGKTDDTAVIQKALSLQQTTSNTTVFFPAGTYLITTTLILNRTLGTALLGTGRTTTLLWGGGVSGGVGPYSNVSRLLWSDGNTRHYMEGLTFDAGNGCAVGLDHAAAPGTQYESFNTHRNMRFTGFTVAGIRIGHAQPPHGNDIASAEQQFTNLIFDRNGAGVSFEAWNDYDNYFSGCVFANNAYGVHCIACNYYIQNTRFQQNNISDVLLPAHSSSIRRVVSVGSAAFVLQTDNNAFSAILKVSETLVSGWGSAAAPSPAICYQTRGPLVLVDTVFDSPANPSSPVILLRESTCAACPAGVGGNGGVWEAITLVNATTRGNSGPMLDPASTVNVTHLYKDFPPGDAGIAAGLSPLTVNTQFFNPAPWGVPTGKVFDAVGDFGASNTGQETSKQVQACMDAAAAAGNDAVCYLRGGSYAVNKSLVACGSDWTLQGGGSGFQTHLTWHSQGGGHNESQAIVLTTGPGAGCSITNFTIQRLCIETNGGNFPSGYLDFALSRSTLIPASPQGQQLHGPRHPAMTLPGGGNPSTPIHFTGDNFYFQSNGGVLNGLGAGDVAHGPMWNGQLEIWDSEAAIILPQFLSILDGGMTVARSLPAPSPALRAGGFLGVAVAVSASSLWDIRLYNSTGLTLGSYYTETSFSNIYWEGMPGDPPGVISIDSSKMCTMGSPKYPTWVFNNSAGLFFHMGAQGVTNQLSIIQGQAALDVVVVASEADDANTQWQVSGAPVRHSQGNMVAPYEMGPPYPQQGWQPDVVNANTPKLMQQGLDQLRRLGTLDLQINLPWTSF